ncbi:ABC transporter substrate-binding protein [Phycicoccus sp. BSK3Z-2]|uniref:ABC transporter substrate-binding protein n=1 Tax=Phycicoccus avicenniae TaxID=2828860 RepID=A0A941D7S8_9MICO|nr:ABC transporter substrate-binding protein [Phycicoccus avicenniae]MBR7742683.1 ABC transporter substrate-binding protein [Phycicoccus avicenniae]
MPAPSRTARRRILVPGVALLAAGALASCSSAVDAGSSGGEATDGGTVTFAVALDANPANALSHLARNDPWVGSVYDSLVRKDENGEPQPRLATEWTVSEDGTQVSVMLRDDVTFHNGDQFDAEDVVFTFDAVANQTEGSNLKYLTPTSVEAVSATQVDLTFDNPPGDALFDWFEAVPMLDSEQFSATDDGTTVNGTGPFAFTDWQPGAGYTLVKNEDYWEGDVNLDSIDYIVTGDPTAQLSALRSGRAQMAWGLTASDVTSMTSDPQWEAMDAGGTIYSFNVNLTKKPFDEAKAREAIGYAIDYERINEQVFGGTGTISNVFWDPELPGMTDDLVTHYSYDPERAKELIEEAGATGASVPISFGPNPALKAQFEIVQNNLADIGLKPSANQLDNGAFGAGLAEGDLGPAYMHLNGQVGLSPRTMLDSLPQIRKGNASQLWNDEYVAKREAIKTATDDAGFESAVVDLTEYLQEEAVAFPLIQAPIQVVHQANIEGVTADRGGPMHFEGAAITE